MLINIVKEERNVLKISHINRKWQFGLHIPEQSPAWKKPSCWGLRYFLPPQMFLFTKYQRATTCRLFYYGSKKSSLIHTEATRSFSESTAMCFTPRFCHNYFLKAAVWWQAFWWVRCPGTAVTPLSFLKWKLRSSRAPQDPKPPSDPTLHPRALLGRAPRGW